MKRKIKKFKRQVQRQATPRNVSIVVGAIAVIAVVFFLMTSSGASGLYEVTEQDVLSLSHVPAEQITIKGVQFGDSLETVIEKLGFPDSQQVTGEGYINVEFGKKLGLESTGVIVHLENNRVTRMTIKEPLNEFLQGKTKIGLTKEEMVAILGTPSKLERLPVTKGSTRLMRLYSFNERNIGILMVSGHHNAVIFGL